MKKKREQLKGFSQVIQHQWTKLLFCICYYVSDLDSVYIGDLGFCLQRLQGSLEPGSQMGI